MDAEDEADTVVVRIELWPDGDHNKARPLGTVIISNDGTGTPSIGNYDVVLTHGGKYVARKGAWRSGKVLHFRRLLSPYHLVLRALAACRIY